MLCTYSSDSVQTKPEKSGISDKECILDYSAFKNLNLLTENIGGLIPDILLRMHYNETMKGKQLDPLIMSSLLKCGYALVLLQIAAKLIYEGHEFKIKNPQSAIKFEDLVDVVKNKNVNLSVDGQSIDIEARFVEGSLSYLRKIVATVILITGIEESGSGKTKLPNFTIDNVSHCKILKKLSNKNFSCDPRKELYMLMNLMGWIDESKHESIDFYSIITDAQSYTDSDNEIIAILNGYLNSG